MSLLVSPVCVVPDDVLGFVLNLLFFGVQVCDGSY